LKGFRGRFNDLPTREIAEAPTGKRNFYFMLHSFIQSLISGTLTTA
jgi:hypothetical protein